MSVLEKNMNSLSNGKAKDGTHSPITRNAEFVVRDTTVSMFASDDTIRAYCR